MTGPTPPAGRRDLLALTLAAAAAVHPGLQRHAHDLERLTPLSPPELPALDVEARRSEVDRLLPGSVEHPAHWVSRG